MSKRRRPPKDYDAYLDDQHDQTTAFGYGEDADADSAAADEPDEED